MFVFTAKFVFKVLYKYTFILQLPHHIHIFLIHGIWPKILILYSKSPKNNKHMTNILAIIY